MRRRTAFLLLGLLALQGAALASDDAQKFVEGLLAEYRTMKPEAPKGSALPPADQQHNDQVRKDLLARLDVEKLGRLSLQDHWEKLAEAQRKDFLQVLRHVLEERSLKNIRATTERFEVQYDGVDQLEGGDALVKTILQVKNDEYFIDFKLSPQGEGWIIYDVITDDVSTVRNYRDQFNKIIAEKGFDELLRRMRENLIDNPSVGKKESDGG